LDYEIEELSIGKFKCTIQLPIQNNYGSYMIAEVQHDGKKKECMTLCESKKKKNKDWETADYYDSDEDTYLVIRNFLSLIIKNGLCMRFRF